MPAVMPVVAAIVTAYASNRASKSNERVAQMQQDAQRANAINGVMPLDNGEAIQAAKKQSIMDQIAGRGRAGTLLSDSANSDKLGGG